MKTITGRICQIVLFAAIFQIVASCNKSEINSNPPTIQFTKTTGFVYSDTTAVAASSLVFKITCVSNGANNLTNIIVKNNGVRVVDEGLNQPQLVKEITIVKSSETTEVLEFIIRDIQGNSASISVTIKLDTKTPAGNVIRFNNISLNAQNAVGGKSFVSLFNGTPLTLQEAFSNQADIHLLYYYDLITSDAQTIASPGANIDNSVYTGDYGLANWITKNTTRFNQIAMTLEEFEAITSPVVLVDSYSEADGKRKAKNLVAGNTFSFKVESTNKYGILRISEVVGEDQGSVTFSVVIQE